MSWTVFLAIAAVGLPLDDDPPAMAGRSAEQIILGMSHSTRPVAVSGPSTRIIEFDGVTQFVAERSTPVRAQTQATREWFPGPRSTQIGNSPSPASASGKALNQVEKTIEQHRQIVTSINALDHGIDEAIKEAESRIPLGVQRRASVAIDYSAEAYGRSDPKSIVLDHGAANLVKPDLTFQPDVTLRGSRVDPHEAKMELGRDRVQAADNEHRQTEQRTNALFDGFDRMKDAQLRSVAERTRRSEEARQAQGVARFEQQLAEKAQYEQNVAGWLHEVDQMKDAQLRTNSERPQRDGSSRSTQTSLGSHGWLGAMTEHERDAATLLGSSSQGRAQQQATQAKLGPSSSKPGSQGGNSSSPKADKSPDRTSGLGTSDRGSSSPGNSGARDHTGRDY